MVNDGDLMTGRPTPEMFCQARVPLDEQTLIGLRTADDVWQLAYRLMREAATYLSLSGIVLSTNEGQPIPYRRDGAILAGTLVRVGKLIRSFCQLVDGRQGYGAKALERLINESLVNFMYLTMNNSPEEFDRYVRGGLGNLKKALEMVKDAPCANHALAPVVQSVVGYVFQTAGFTIEEIDTRDDRSWDVNVRSRLEAFINAPYRDVPPEEVAGVEYLGMFAGPAGNVHGDWPDLILNHLKPLGGGFLPDPEGAPPEADGMIRTEQYIGACLMAFVGKVLPQTEGTDWIKAALKDFVCRVDALDNYLAHPSRRGLLFPDERVPGSP